jgi:hypothetical protein
MKLQTIRRLAFILPLITTAGSLAAEELSVTAEDTTITRGDSASLSCSAKGGCAPYEYKWSNWTAGDSSAEKTGASVSAKILEDCSVTVTVTDSADPPATATKTVSITVEKREWNVVHTTSPDAWSNWGSFPFGVFGLNVNANTNAAGPVIGDTIADWSNKITRTKISDANGPFNNCWFNSTHNLRVERETKINQYLKGAVGSVNWVSMQNSFAASPGSYSPVVNAATFRQGIGAHENQGNCPPDFNSNPHMGGHSALFKAKQDSSDTFNAALAIEDAYSSDSEENLKEYDNFLITPVEIGLATASQDGGTPNQGNIDSWIIYDSAGNKNRASL